MRGFNTVIERAMESAGRAIYNFTGDAIKRYAELEKQHSKTMGAMAADYSFNYNGNNTTEQQQNMSKFYSDSSILKSQAITLGTVGTNGKGSLYDPTEISAAQTALIKAGISASDIISTNAITDVIKFAGGNDIDLTDAVDFAVQLGTQFKIDPSMWDDMLDKVSYAANASIIDVADIMESMKYAGNVASGFDQPLGDVLAALAVMGNAGLKGSQAGTGIQAIFTRGMSPTGITGVSAPPTDFVEEQYNNFKDTVTDENGTFVGLGNFTQELSDTMDSLSDEELSWFTRKMFGIFQQKAALALGRTDADGNIIFDEMSSNIETMSGGTNDTMLALQISSLGGQLEAFNNAYTGFKQDFGDNISPIVSNVTSQAIQWLNSGGKYAFDYESLNKSIEESSDNISEKYGESAGSLVDDVGKLVVGLFRSGTAQSGLVGGTIGGIISLLNGDFDTAVDKFKKGLDDTNENIDELPDDLKQIAEGFRNLIIAIEGLYALNIVTRVSEGITSVLRLISGGRIISAKTNVNSASTTMNIASANATIAKMNATTNTMTVYANIVNIIGGKSSSTNPGGSGTGGSGIGGTPALGSGGTPVLGGGGGAGGAAALLGGGAAAGMGSKWFGAKKAIMDANGNVLSRYWSVGGKYMTSGQILASASRMLGLAGVIGANLFQTGDSTSRTRTYQDLLTKGSNSGLDNSKLRDYITGGFSGEDSDWAGKRFDTQTEMVSYWMSAEGSADMMKRIKDEMSKNGSLSEDFIGQLMTYTGSTGGTYTGGNDQMASLMNILFGEGYTPSWIYGGSYDNENMSKFINGRINDNPVDQTVSDVVSSDNAVSSALLDGINRIADNTGTQTKPIFNVNVDVNVDKDGHVSKSVITDYSNVDSWLYRNTLRFGNNTNTSE